MLRGARVRPAIIFRGSDSQPLDTE